MTKRPTVYRQGDVLLIAVDADLRDDGQQPVAREHGKIILAHGEATGHAHAIEESTAVLVEAPTTNVRHLRLVKPATLLHEEHREIEIPPGLYEVRRQREYSPSEIRTVAD
jgi:hypothetical protein